MLAAATLVAGEAVRVPATAERAIEQISAGELRAHVETLASDDFGGRALGTAGNERARDYAAGTARTAGV